MCESEHIGAAERRKLHLQLLRPGVEVDQPEKLIFEQNSFICQNLRRSLLRPDHNRPIRINLPFILLHLPLKIFQLGSDDRVSLGCVGWLLVGNGEKVEIVEVLAVVPAEAEEGVADHQRGMLPARLGATLRLQLPHPPGGGVEHEHVVGVGRRTHPPRQHVDPPLKHVARVPPTLQTPTALHHLLPNEVTRASVLEQPAQVDPVDVAHELIVIPAPANHVEVASNDCGAVEPPLPGAGLRVGELEPAPAAGGQVEGPAVVEVDVGDALPAVDHQVGVVQLGAVVSALPGRLLRRVRLHPAPRHRRQLQHEHAVEAQLIEGAAAEQDHLVPRGVVVNGVVGAAVGQVP